MLILVHHYIADTFSGKLKLFKPHAVVTRKCLSYIRFNIDAGDRYTQNMVYLLLHDHIFNPAVWDKITVWHPDKFRTPASHKEASDLVLKILTDILLMSKEGTYVEIPYKAKNAIT